jgi:hypothetical protein
MFDDLYDTEEEEELEEPFMDPVQAALLASFVMAHQERNNARAVEEVDVAILNCVIDISHVRVPMEEDARLIMKAAGEKINELNKQTRSI